MKHTVSLYIFFCLLYCGKAVAQWDGNANTVNNPIATSTSPLFSEMVVTDQFGGAIVLWKENNQLLVRRKTVGGILSWKSSGPITLNSSSTAGLAQVTDMIADGNGGVFVSWTLEKSDSSIDLFLQHIASNGEKTFADTGIRVNPSAQAVCTEGKLSLSDDGVFIVWATEKNQEQVARTIGSMLYLQKYNSAGLPTWNDNVVPVSTAPGFKFWPSIVSDGSGGVYVSFTDTRNSTNSVDGYHDQYDVFVQRFDSNGNQLWGTNDVAVNSVSTSEISLSDYSPPFVKQRKGLFTDDLGRPIVLYREDEQGYGNFVYAQKLTDAGIAMWGNGIRISPLNSSAIFIQIHLDSNNGFVIAWKNVGENKLSIQKIDSSGNTPWGTQGIQVNSEQDVDASLTGIGMSRDTEGNFVIAWKIDSLVHNQLMSFIKAQKVSTLGIFMWDSSGTFISTVPNEMASYPTVLSSLNATNIITWGGSRGIFSALVNTDGTLKTISSIDHTPIASGNWNDPSIWSSGILPPPGANILITQSITVNVPIICNSITVQPPAILTINAGVNVTVFNN